MSESATGSKPMDSQNLGAIADAAACHLNVLRLRKVV